MEEGEYEEGMVIWRLGLLIVAFTVESAFDFKLRLQFCLEYRNCSSGF